MSKRVIAKLALIVMSCISQQAFSAGFFIFEQSASGLGNAFAGSAAVAEDATTIFFNPAGLSRLCHQQVVAGVSGIFPYAKFHNDDSPLSPALGNGPLFGGNGGNAAKNALIGHFYYAKPWRCGLSFGFGMTAPFGLITKYDSEWVGRYHATYSKLRTFNINPCLAYSFNKCISIGVGFNAMYAKADLRNAIDFGSILFAQTGGMVGVPQLQDGKGKVTGDSWGYGGNIGLLWDITKCTRLGLHYRSEIRQHLKGKIHLDDVPTPLAGVFVDGAHAKAKVTLPSLLTFSAYHQINPCWAVLGDITWTKWDVLRRLRIKFDSPQPDAITTLKWENTFRYALAVNYRPCCPLLLRAGLAYDETPIPNKKHRTPRIPDQNRIWATLGCGYDWLSCLHFDFAYAHLFVKKPKVDKTSFINNPESEDFFRGGLRGHWNARTDIVSAQVVWDF
jgi:long-chain fatty acid transport protein